MSTPKHNWRAWHDWLRNGALIKGELVRGKKEEVVGTIAPMDGVWKIRETKDAEAFKLCTEKCNEMNGVKEI